MHTRSADASRRSLRPPPLVVLGFVALVALIGCEFAPQTLEPPSVPSAPTVLRPGIQIDETWAATNGEWTFTGRVDPQRDPTDVVLEVGPGPATLRRFDARLPVAEDLSDSASLTITTREIPDIDEICVRFTATNSAGSSSSTPLCFPHDLPSFAPAPPTVGIDDRWTAANGEWTFTGRVDPGGAATDVVLEIGTGPAAAPQFTTQVPAGQGLTEQATLTITTREVPDAGEICVRFTATNALGTSSSTPLCLPQAPAP